MKGKKNASRQRGWTYTVGDLTAYERKDRDHAIWTRLPGAKPGTYRDRKPLCSTIRNEAGEIDPELENNARQLTVNRQRYLVAGTEPIKGGKLTLGAAIKLYLHPKEGKYATNTDWKKDVTRYLGLVLDVLGDVPISELKRASYRTVWRHIARVHIADSEKFGLRAAEMIVGAFRSMVVWLIDEEHVDGASLPKRKWKEAMEHDWAELTGEQPREPARPRNSPEESEKLWAALPEADPREMMLFELGAELRLGQVVRCRRKDLFAYEDHTLGGIEVIGRGKKHGETVFFTDDQRDYVRGVLESGYLSELEKAYKKGEINDYYLVPGGFLAKGKASVRWANTLASGRAMRNWYRDLEILAKVQHEKGRGWYGERRQRLQKGEKDTIASPSGKNRMSGHTQTETRILYVGTMDDTFGKEAMELRARTRPKAGRTTPTHDTTEPSVN